MEFSGSISHLGVSWRDPFVRARILVIWMSDVCPDAVDSARDDEGEELLACPQRPWFQYGWLGHVAVPYGQEHEKVHHVRLQRYTLPRHATAQLKIISVRINQLQNISTFVISGTIQTLRC